MLQVELVNCVEAERAFLPAFFPLVIEVLEHARPAVDVSAFGDPGAYHLAEGLHANRTLDLSGAHHVVSDEDHISPVNCLVGIEEIPQVRLIFARTLLIIILNHKFHGSLHELFLVEILKSLSLRHVAVTRLDLTTVPPGSLGSSRLLLLLLEKTQ